MPDHVADICDKCGERHERMHKGTLIPTCKAHKNGGLPCMRSPIENGTVCRFHGGDAPQTRAAAVEAKERELLNQRAAAVLADINPNPMHSDPLRGLLWEVAMSANAVEWYAARLGELGVPVPGSTEVERPADEEGMGDEQRDPLAGVHMDRFGRPVWGRQEPDVIWGHDHNGDQAVHILLKLWTEERERHAMICERAIRAGVQERLGAMIDAQAAAIANVVTYVVEALGFDEATREQARQLAAGRMRAMPPTVIADSRLTR